jgi:putative ABC transport system permease protein
VVGVAVMVLLRGFINGMRVGVLDGAVRGNLGAVQVHKTGYLANVQGLPLSFDMPDSDEIRQKLGAIDGVLGVSARINFGAMVSMPDPSADEQGSTAYFMAFGIEPEREAKVTPKRWQWLNEGRIFDSPDADELVLNADFNRGLGAKVTADKANPPPEATWPALLAADRDGALNGANVKLVGTVVQGTPGDKRTGLVPLHTAQKLLRMEGRVTEYALAVPDVLDSKRLEQIKAQAEAALGPEYEVHTWDEVMPFMRTMLRAQDVVFSGIIAVFLLVALLGIVNTLLMNVLERVREIGTMLAVGTRRGQILMLFVFEGLVQGLMGGMLGAVIGYGATVWLGHQGINLPAPGSTVPMLLRPFIAPSFVLLAVFFATAGSSLAALYPAWRASKLRPVEALASV